MGSNYPVRSNSIGENGGGDSVADLYEILRDEDLTPEILEEYSNTDEGFSAWTRVIALPKVFLSSPIIENIRRSPSVLIAVTRNDSSRDAIGEFDYLNMISTERALEIADYNLSDFREWVEAERDIVGLTELSYSRAAMEVIAADEQKCAIAFNSNWFMTVILDGMPAIMVLSQSDLAMSFIGDYAFASEKFFAVDPAVELWRESLEGITGFFNSNGQGITHILQDETTHNAFLGKQTIVDAALGTETAGYAPMIESAEFAPKYCSDQMYIAGSIGDDTVMTYISTSQPGSKAWAETRYAMEQMMTSQSACNVMIYEDISFTEICKVPTNIDLMANDTYCCNAIASDQSASNILATNAESVGVFAASSIAPDILYNAQYWRTALMTNPTSLGHWVAHTRPAQLAAADLLWRQDIFADGARRAAVWDHGGKVAADEFMRNNTECFDWLEANVKVVTNGNINIAKRGWFLRFHSTSYCSNSSHYQQMGNFVGDHRGNGSYWRTGKTDDSPHHFPKERVKNIYGYSSHTAVNHYVIME